MSRRRLPEARWDRTKIICTLGPSTDRPRVLERLIRAGMDVARINTAHGTLEEHRRRMRQVRALSHRLGEPVGILVDLPGPKFRLATLEGGTRVLVAGRRVNMSEAADANSIPLDTPGLLRQLHAGESLYLADGSVQLRVRAVSRGAARCEVVVGGLIRSGSGVNLPESTITTPLPTRADRVRIRLAVAQRAEWIGVSFVRSARDVARVRASLPRAGPRPLLMAKIERRQALAELEAIVGAADGVMVARGDLGVETDLAEVPLVQKRIIDCANRLDRPVVTATQMLESMVAHPRPTRAEVTDVANAVLDGTDAVMLSAETAIGKFPVEAAQILHRVLRATEAEYADQMNRQRLEQVRSGPAPDEAISLAACRLAADLRVQAMLLHVRNLAGVMQVARLRPIAPVIAMVETPRLAQQLAGVWGVVPLLVAAASTSAACAQQACRWLVQQRWADPGEPVLLLSSAAADATPDTLQVIRVGGPT